MIFSLCLPKHHAEHSRTMSWSPQHLLQNRKQSIRTTAYSYQRVKTLCNVNPLFLYCNMCCNINLTLLSNLEVLLAAQHHSLQHLMGRHVGLEVSWIPKFSHQLTKPLHQEEHDVPRWPADSSIVFLFQEVVSQRWNIGKSLGRRIKYKTAGIIKKFMT